MNEHEFEVKIISKLKINVKTLCGNSTLSKTHSKTKDPGKWEGGVNK